MEDVHLNTNWEDVTCPICLEFPHNSVLLQCSSYGKGCRPFVCDTDHLQSNCLQQFKSSFGMSVGSNSPSTSEITTVENPVSAKSEESCKPTCPLCRGDVTGWVIIDNARAHLDKKHRCCEEERCNFKGTFMELQKHAQIEHPHACPSKVDPARQLDWENFQQSSEIIDVLSTIHSEVPRGVVLGDYVIEYGDDDTGDEFEAFPGDEGNWWTSCILYQTYEEYVGARGPARLTSDHHSPFNPVVKSSVGRYDKGIQMTNWNAESQLRSRVDSVALCLQAFVLVVKYVEQICLVKA
ncbi:Protein of unknown function DUF1644 [Dillenia turbinata]|uniref:Uncharacterized protein n=1 Tax=Dillenia turbinata TaxID=194707 RepID=A0AAN8ZRT7_9MAGN